MIDPTNEHKPSPNSSRPLSEISHLFLSSLRQQAGGADRARPVRIPPGGAKQITDDQVDAEPQSTRKRVTAVIGAHLGGNHLAESAIAYAASVAADGYRVGMIALDASEFRIQLIECGGEPAATDPEVTERFDDRQMTDGLLELNHDVDRWLLVVPDPRKAEARTLLSRCDDWTMVGTCDHDGIVGGYRTLKGLAEAGGRSPLAIAFTDANDDEQASRSFAKLAAVCRQFLDWDVTQELLASDVEDAQVHTVLWCRGTHEKSQLANAPQWRVAQRFLELTPDAAADAAHYGTDEGTDEVAADSAMFSATEYEQDDEDLAPIDAAAEEQPMIKTPTTPPIDAQTFAPTFAANQPLSIPPIARPIAPIAAAPIANAPAAIAAPIEMPAAMPFMSIAPAVQPSNDLGGDVIDLPDGVSVLSAVLRSGTQLLATPIAPPMCPGATVAVGRDRGLVLVAQAGTGLAGLDSIANAVRWLDDSKQLIAMAMPQLSVDSNVATRVELLIDHTDRTAEGLRPLLGNSRITIRSYRKLRWAGRTGLLLDAA